MRKYVLCVDEWPKVNARFNPCIRLSEVVAAPLSRLAPPPPCANQIFHRTFHAAHVSVICFTGNYVLNKSFLCARVTHKKKRARRRNKKRAECRGDTLRRRVEKGKNKLMDFRRTIESVTRHVQLFRGGPCENIQRTSKFPTHYQRTIFFRTD